MPPPLICLKIKSFLLVSCLVLCGFGDVGWVNGQGEECGTDIMMELLFSEYPESLTDFENLNNEWAYYDLTKNHHSEDEIITIPVVVHILHDDGMEDGDGDITDDQVKGAIKRLNNNFRAISGTSGESGKDTHIEFRLANIDEDGGCTEGITHNNIPIRFGYTGNLNADTTMKGQVRWDPFKYMNIYVTDCFAKIPIGTPIDQVNCDPFNPLNVDGRGFVGYVTTAPHDKGEGSVQAKVDGIVIWDQFFISSETLTHETGHYMDLLHTFYDIPDCTQMGEFLCVEDSSMPPCCKQYGDRCCDTNLCSKQIYNPPLCNSISYTACLDLAYPKENYMSYGKCKIEFTSDQIDRMHFALNESSSRTPLWTNENLIATGIAVASATESVICNNESTTLSVTADNTADSIRWFVKDGDQTLPTVINKNTITVSPNMTTIYGVAVNEGQNCFDEDEITITVNPLPTLPFSNNGISTYNRCDGDGITINLDRDFQEIGVSNPNYSYEWYNQNGDKVNTTGEFTISGNDPMNYDVLITDNVTQCSNWQMVETPMVDGFSASLETIPLLPVYCEAVIINPLITPTNGAFIPQNYSYEWSTGSKENKIDYLPEESGTSIVTVEITDMTTECTETVTQTINFQSGIPQPNLQKSIDSPLSPLEECGQKLTVTNSNSFDTFKWYLDGVQISDQSGPSYLAKEKGTYYIIGVNTTIGCETKSENMPVSHDDLKSHTITQDSLPSTQDIDTTGTTTWMSGDGSMTNRIIDGYIEIEDGQKLVIQGQNTVLQFFDGSSGIKVRKGGVLVIDEATLEASDCVGEWGGIIVYGDGFKAHPDYTDGTTSSNGSFIGSPDHGLVVLRNGATVQNARTAVSSTFSYDALDNNGQPYNYGGGIVYADGANFLNNNTSLLIGQFKAEGNNIQKSVIKKCVFTNSTLWENNGFFGNFGSTVQNTNKGYEQVFVYRSGEGLQITENTFKSNINSNVHSEHGTGLRVVATKITIGEQGNDPSNVFDGLYKGIDIYNPLSIDFETAILNNQFEKVYKGITINSAPSTSIIANTFNVPQANFSNKETYGILTHQSFGFEISNNCFVTEGGISNSSLNYTKGIVLKDCNFNGMGGTDMSSANGNTFDGLFKAATQIERNSTTLQLRCNDYDQTIAPLRDWQLPEKSADLQMDTEMDGQGICNSTLPSQTVFSNRWHSGNDGVHIYNDSNHTLEFEHDLGSTTNNFTGNAIFDECFVGGSSVSANCANYSPNNNCQAPMLAAGDGGIPFPYYYPHPTNPYPNNACIVYGEHIRYLLGNRQTQSVINILNCRNNKGSNKLLAATHAIRGDVSAATIALNNISDNNYTDHEFKTLIRAVLNNRINDIERIAEYQYSENAAYAQSLLATFEGKQYDRISAKVVSSQGHSKRAVGEKIDKNFSSKIVLFPNPAQNTLQLVFKTVHIFLSKNT